MDEMVTCQNPACRADNPADRRKCRRCRRVLRPQSAGERSAAASIAANSRWSRVTDRRAATAAATAAGVTRIDYWLARVDPDGEMDAQTRQRAAENARLAWYGQRTKAARKAARRT